MNFPKSLLGPKLWIIYAATDVPSIGKIMKEVTNNDLFGSHFDTHLSERAQKHSDRKLVPKVSRAKPMYLFAPQATIEMSQSPICIWSCRIYAD